MEPGGVQFFVQQKEYNHCINDKFINNIHVKLFDENFVSLMPEQQWNCSLDLQFFKIYEQDGFMNQHNALHDNRFGETGHYT